MNQMTVDIGYAPDWVADMKKKLAAGDMSDPHVREIYTLPQPGQKAIDFVEFTKVVRSQYLAEVGKKGNDIIFHFFTSGETFPRSEATQTAFEDVMGDAFIEVFRLPDRLQAAFTEELRSWAVRVIGFADNPAANMLAGNLFDALDRRLKL